MTKAFRLLTRKYNVQLCYTPMLHAKRFIDEKDSYRKKEFITIVKDRPLIAQFCANNANILLKAAKLIEDQVDAIDINLGCPQNIAKRGHYGAYLQDEWDLIFNMELKIPVTCKIRIFEDLEKTLEYAKMLEKAGCYMLTVHGRTREQKGQYTGLADWNIIKIPVIANGNIMCYKDVIECLKKTQADGVMSAALFSNKKIEVFQMVKEYLDICEFETEYSLKQIRMHLHKFFDKYPEYRAKMCMCNSLISYRDFNDELKQLEEYKEYYRIHGDNNRLTEYPYWICQPYIRPILNNLEETLDL